MPALKSDPPWLKAAFKDIGLREIAGAKHNLRVVEMFRKAGHPSVSNDETAWCAAAMGCWLVEGESKGSGSLMARSYLKYGRALDTSKKLPRGAIAVWPRGEPPSGHVNIVIGDDGTTLTCIGGNQSPAPGTVSISKEKKSRLLGARWPTDQALPTQRPTPIPPPPDIPKPEPKPEKQPWYKRLWAKISGVIGLGTGLTVGGVTLDASFLYAVCGLMITGTIAFLVWVYLVPPRGRIRKHPNA